MRAHGGRDAVVTDAGVLSYEALGNRVAGVACALRGTGIGPGSVVGIILADEVEHLVASLALLASGARQITLATHDAPAVQRTLAARVRTTHVLSDRDEDISAGLGAGHLRWPRTVDALNQDGPSAEGMMYLMTSGTTGDMNIVAFTGAQLALQASRNPDYANGRLLRLASIEHNNSKRHRLYCAYQGGANVFRPTGDFNIAAFCARHGVTCIDISRMHASDLAGHGDTPLLAGVQLRTGGSPIPFDVRRVIEQRVTPLLFVRYGATECGTIATAGPGEHDEAESVGQPAPGVTVEIVDADGQLRPTGESGHIRLRAGGVASSYLDSAEEAKRRFRDGWFWPGDIGMLRADGSLVVQGRQDDMMILNGINIFPNEIERVLEGHPAVLVAAALPLVSPVHGQIPVAAVELRPGATVARSELLMFAREQLALRAPRRVLIFDALPRNSEGKVLRREIAKKFVPTGSAD